MFNSSSLTFKRTNHFRVHGQQHRPQCSYYKNLSSIKNCKGKEATMIVVKLF